MLFFFSLVAGIWHRGEIRVTQSFRFDVKECDGNVCGWIRCHRIYAWIFLSAGSKSFAFCFYNLFHFYASFQRFDVKPCIKWASTSTTLHRVWDNATKNVSLNFISWKTVEIGTEEVEEERTKNSFTLLVLFFVCPYRERSLLFSSFRLVFFCFSIEIPFTLFRSLCTFIITSDTNRCCAHLTLAHTSQLHRSWLQSFFHFSCLFCVRRTLFGN